MNHIFYLLLCYWEMISRLSFVHIIELSGFYFLAVSLLNVYIFSVCFSKRDAEIQFNQIWNFSVAYFFYPPGQMLPKPPRCVTRFPLCASAHEKTCFMIRFIILHRILTHNMNGFFRWHIECIILILRVKWRNARSRRQSPSMECFWNM